MNIICEKNILNEAVTAILPVVSSKNTNKSLEGFLITADKDSGTLVVCGYDMEKGAKVTISGDKIQIDESGSIIVNAEKFSSIVKNLPDGKISVVADAALNVTIMCGKSRFTVNGLDGETFPAMPELKSDKNVKLPCKTLKDMIKSTLFSAANNNSRPALNGVLFEIRGNQMNAVSCDGNRLSLRRSCEGLTSDGELDIHFIAPGKSLSELLKLLNGDDKSVEIDVTQKHVIISFDNIIFFSRLIESDFIDYKKIMKTEPKTTIIVNTRDFLSSIERAAVLTDDKPKTIVKLNFVKNEIDIENENKAGIVEITSSSSIGKTSDECGVEIHGENVTIGFNQRYLAEALRAVKDDKILMQIESPTKSMIILPYSTVSTDEKSDSVDINTDTEVSKFVYLVLPVFLREENKK